MTAELLREAAALMRERAEAATPGPWMRAEPWDRAVGQVDGPWVAETTALGQATAANAEHIASWQPAVALAVADWLNHAAARAESKIEHGGKPEPAWSHERDALAVASAYLGRES